MDLSQLFCEAILLMQLLDDLKKIRQDTHSRVPGVLWKALIDNFKALELARLPKLRPITNHINQMFHHLQSFVKRELIKVLPILPANNSMVTYSPSLCHRTCSSSEGRGYWVDNEASLQIDIRECGIIARIYYKFLCLEEFLHQIEPLLILAMFLLFFLYFDPYTNIQCDLCQERNDLVTHS